MRKRITDARKGFESALKNPENLLKVAAEHTWPAGFPAKRRTMYEATAALTVAAWQAYAQDLARAVFKETATASKATGTKLMTLSEVLVEDQIAALNTPNSRNVQRLFGAVGFDLSTGWTVAVKKPANYILSPDDAMAVLDLWVHVRHAVAHGFPFAKSRSKALLKQPGTTGKTKIITGSAPGGKGKAVMAVNRDDADACVHFFRRIADVVAAEADAHCKAL